MRLHVTLISWSPDGKWIAFADVLPEEEHSRIYLLSTETLETRQIPINPMCVGEGLPAFSHNGEYLAYWCFRGWNDAVLYSLPDSGWSAERNLILSGYYPSGLTWSADDKKLIYSSYSLGNESPLKLLSPMGRRNNLPSQEVNAADSSPEGRQACLRLSFH